LYRENGSFLQSNKSLQDAITDKYLFYTQCVVLQVRSDGHFILGVPFDGQPSNQSRWMKFDATASEIHQLGWCDKNFDELRGEQMNILDGNGKMTLVNATIYSKY
jgi:hypothetical protein